MNASNKGSRAGDYQSPLTTKQRAFLAYSRDATVQPRAKRMQKDIAADLLGMANAALPAGAAPVGSHQFSAVPRISPAEGDCNWQVVVFLPLASEVLTAIGEAAAELQGRYDMADFYQGTRALIV